MDVMDCLTHHSSMPPDPGTHPGRLSQYPSQEESP